MLFDLQGKRRRVVQATYLALAVLMGGGLVLFGIGGEVSGGLFDAFSGNSGSGNDVIEERLDRNEERVKRRPRDTEARAELVRDYYSYASTQTPQGATAFSEDSRDELRQASVHWDAYLDLVDKPDPAVARIALQVYDPAALDQPDNALRAARIVARAGNDPGSYLQLVQYAALAQDNRTLKLAEQKALDLARNDRERRAVRKQLRQVKQQILAQQIQRGDVEVEGLPGGSRQNGQGGAR